MVMELRIFLGCLLGCYGMLLCWYRSAWRRLSPYIPAEEKLPCTSITIIIPARNEALTIGACLQCLVEQQYPVHLLRVLVMNDDSTDDTAGVVAAFSKNYPNVQCVPVLLDAATQAHKKRAIEQGIAKATGELIVCTDADCTMGPLWLATLAKRFEQGDVAFIAAPVQYHTRPTLLSVFQTLDFMTLQGISGASVSQRFHTMCNGANIAYAKSAFEAVNGFAGIDALPTGDDMLLMYKIYQQFPDGVVWLKSKDATVATQACPSWPSFFQQRIRWASKAAYFQDKRMVVVLALVYAVNLIWLLMFFAAFFWPVGWLEVGLALLIKISAEAYFLFPVAQFFDKQKWMIWFPFLQGHHIVYTVVAGWLGKFGSYQWKGRAVSKPEALMKKK